MKLACCTWALAGPEETILDQLVAIGFQWIDIRSVDFTDVASHAQIAARNLQISCVGLSFALPAGVSLDSADEAARAVAVQVATGGLTHAARVGARAAYVIPGLDDSPQALDRYAQSLTTLADYAAKHAIKLCVEHFPGRALPTIDRTLHYLRRIDHPNLYLLFDIGHAQMSQEEPVAALQAAGQRLGYVHLDDNDGQRDLHWALLDGVLTRTVLHNTISALQDLNYTGGVSLELSPQLPNPRDALHRSWRLLEEVYRAKS